MSGARTRDYALPTLAAFANQARVSNVIEGTVVSARPTVTGPASVVETILTVDVSAQRDRTAPTTVEVREQGGVVPMVAVRTEFEEKLDRSLSSDELAEMVDFRFEGEEHAKVGDHVLVIAAADGAKDRYVSLARLEAESSALRRDGAEMFSWPGEPPNAKWPAAIEAQTLLD